MGRPAARCQAAQARIARLTGEQAELAQADAERETETIQRRWLVALGDARRSDTDRATVERIQRAGAGEALWDPDSRPAEGRARRLERVRASAAEPSETPPGQ